MVKELKKNMVIWSLFDSGNGSYFNTLKDMDNIENFSVGLDRENKNSHSGDEVGAIKGIEKLIKRYNKVGQ